MAPVYVEYKWVIICLNPTSPHEMLQLRDVHVEVHPVEALDLEHGVLGDDFRTRCAVTS